MPTYAMHNDRTHRIQAKNITTLRAWSTTPLQFEDVLPTVYASVIDCNISSLLSRIMYILEAYVYKDIAKLIVTTHFFNYANGFLEYIYFGFKYKL